MTESTNIPKQFPLMWVRLENLFSFSFDVFFMEKKHPITLGIHFIENLPFHWVDDVIERISNYISNVSLLPNLSEFIAGKREACHEAGKCWKINDMRT